jgi:hypothetical protein
MGDTIYFAVGDVAEHSGSVTSKDASDMWTPENPGGWTLGGVQRGGRILYEGPSERDAHAALDAFLVCDAAERGVYCYSHNPYVDR